MEPQIETLFWYPRAVFYNPVQAGSIDGIVDEPHDKAVVRAQNAKYKPNYKVVGISEHTVFVARLSKDTTEKQIIKKFSEFGKIIRTRLVKDVVTNISRGFAFVEYENEKQANNAVCNGNRLFINGKLILVDYECERLLPGWVPRRLGGGFGGFKESGQLRFGGKDKPFIKPILFMSSSELINKFKKREQYVDHAREIKSLN